MSLLQIGDTEVDAEFRKRVRAQVYKSANAFVGEDPASSSQEQVDKRHLVCQRVFRNDEALLVSFYAAVAADIGEVDDPSTITDVQIETSVNGLWDGISGVKYGE